MGRLLEGFGVGIISYTVIFQCLFVFSVWICVIIMHGILVSFLLVGARVYSRDSTSKLERGVGFGESGLLHFLALFVSGTCIMLE